MKVRLGQPVWATDGEFGEVGDIVVDPHQRTVTHLVVEPHRQHLQARLVPLSLISIDGDTVRVDLDIAHLRQLQLVAHDDYVHLGEMIPASDEWDIGTEDVLALPYWDSEDEFGTTTTSDLVSVAYDRIPKGECEIRRRSVVTTADGYTVGHVDGFLADDDHLVAVLVQAGIPGRRYNVVLPISEVVTVRNDEIQLIARRDDFRRLPRSKDPNGPPGEVSTRTWRRTATNLAGRGRHHLAALVGRGKTTLDRGDERDDGDRPH